MNALKIDKEAVSQLHFPTEEVLIKKEDQVNRNISLKRAQVLGNIDHTKMKIIFQDNTGLKKIHTTIWGVTEKYVILKSANVLPLNRIVDVY
ncbi:hypothetical protein [Aquimarina agarivorans]|uniref:hypothetical protein n=1 Tax=Aquimarina agarivorans TaxID=980584 RepID=UPI000248EC40|nr:hypothetical protein [Aquimarina agarivorans]